MRLSIGTGSELVWLARGSTSGELIRDLSVNGQRIASVTPLISATVADVKDFGNLTHTIAFAVDRQHANLEAANLFAFLHPASLKSATGTITAVSEAGGSEQTIYLKSAVITAVGIQLAGISTATAYQIACGDITTTP